VDPVSDGNIADSREVILVADDRGRYVDVSRGACTILGYTRDELLSLDVFALTPDADELDGLIKWQEFIHAGHQAGLYRLRAKDGRILEFRYQAIANPALGRHISRLTPVGVQS
jgi:PAS domain S-box-containing protein